MRTGRSAILAAIPLSAIGLVVSVFTGGAASAAPPDDGYRHASGITVLTEPRKAPVTPQSLSIAAWSEAVDLAMANPDDFGYPWIAGAGAEQRVVVQPVSERGKALAAASALRAGPLAAARELRPVTRSFAELERIKDETIGQPDEVLPGGSHVWMTAPDRANNRVVITVDVLDDRLMEALAARYGTEALVVRVAPRLDARTTSRNSDTSPYWGGASIRTPSTCTDAFAWSISSTTHGMLTAGHCARNGASVYAPNGTYMGGITSGSRENWSDGGTVFLPGSSTYRGDIALIQITSGRSSSGRIYTGGTTSTSSVAVSGFGPNYWVAEGQGFCYGGQTTGEHCGHEVWEVGFNFDYLNDGVLRNGIWGLRFWAGSGTCPQGGDSGGSVYALSGGKAQALGIISGSFHIPLVECDVFFTDIRHAWLAFPGTIKTA